jgi:hypothetical protein
VSRTSALTITGNNHGVYAPIALMTIRVIRDTDEGEASPAISLMSTEADLMSAPWLSAKIIPLRAFISAIGPAVGSVRKQTSITKLQRHQKALGRSRGAATQSWHCRGRPRLPRMRAQTPVVLPCNLRIASLTELDRIASLSAMLRPIAVVARLIAV